LKFKVTHVDLLLWSTATLRSKVGHRPAEAVFELIDIEVATARRCLLQ
jgi:hypothetical protein